MNSKTLVLLAVGAAAISLPLAGSAQSYYGHQTYYGQTRGDYYSRRRVRFYGYPEFRGIEAHIRSEINDGVTGDMLAPEDAADLRQQLRNIQIHEAQEFRAHGWNLPDDDRATIQSELTTLDSLVDQTRDEP